MASRYRSERDATDVPDVTMRDDQTEDSFLDQPEFSRVLANDPSLLAKIDERAVHFGVDRTMPIPDVPALRLLLSKLLSEGRPEADVRRLTYLAFEIKIAHINTHYHVNELAGFENAYLVDAEARASYRPFEDDRSFSLALSRSRAAFAMILRVRALWDKLFIYCTLRFDGDRALHMLQSRRSKRKFFFSKYSAGIGPLPSDELLRARESIESLERSFRSPEVHGFGVIQRWAFKTPKTWPEGHTGPILGHWNDMSHFLHAVFNEADGQRDSFSVKSSRSST